MSGLFCGVWGVRGGGWYFELIWGFEMGILDVMDILRERVFGGNIGF